ncbi:MAG: putative zinc-finger [Acidobacteriota bacterium]|jgi:predicted naringenin-chalcone synthase|nr:putative zinc-finger [Acidobacteriota bacterium]
MTCQELQQALSLYIDDQLPLSTRALCDQHLHGCPLCRVELDELRAITRGLAAIALPPPSTNLASSIKYALSIEATVKKRQPALPLSERLVRWLRPRLMPYAVGSIASVFLFTVMFNALRPHLQALAGAAIAAREEGVSLRVVYVGSDGREVAPTLTAQMYADQRTPFNDESPSLNPRGALAELTRLHAHSKEDEDDMIVVTDVFSDGRASLADIVQPPRDRRMLDDFEVALQKNAAFVPASYDRRPETMRVVFVVQKVEVPERNF